jgi:hypothetical protein
MDIKKFVWWGVGVAAAVVIIAVGIIFVLQSGREEAGEDTSAADQGTSKSTEEDKDAPQAVKIDEQTFEGSGRSAKPQFKAAGGLTIFRFTHAGPQNFVLQIAKGSEAGSLLVNTVGNVSGSKAQRLEAGDYTLQISASGKWKVEVEQPRPTSAPSPPQKLSGEGPGATTFFRLKAGNANFRMTYQGGGIFAPSLVKADGQQLTLLANEQAKFNGSKQVAIPEDGIYLIDVLSTKGNWTIDVAQ